MNNNDLGLLGYLILLISIGLDISVNIKESNRVNLFYNIVQFIGYSLIFYNMYKNQNNEEDEKPNTFELGHIILFLFYFYSLFLSGEKMYAVTLLTLIAHFILMKENNKIIKLGFVLSLIYSLMKIEHYFYDTSYIIRIKLLAFSLLALFYSKRLYK